MKNIEDHIGIESNLNLTVNSTGRTRLIFGSHEDNNRRKGRLEACFYVFVTASSHAIYTRKVEILEADGRVMVFHYQCSHIPTLSHGSNGFSHFRLCSELRTPVGADKPNSTVRLLVITGRLLALRSGIE